MGGPPGAPEEAKYLVLRTVGGEMAPAAALAPKLGPLGLSPKKVGEDIMKSTMDWKGLKVTVKLTILNRQATVSLVPAASSLIIKALKEPYKSRKDKKGGESLHNGDITLDEVIDISRKMRPSSMAREFSGTVKEILGTCNSIGCTVNGEAPTDLQTQIDDGELELPTE